MRVAVGGTWKAIFHASKRLQNDKGILLLATSQDPRALEVIAPRAGETKRGEDLTESASGEQEGKEKAAETPWARGIERALKPLLPKVFSSLSSAKKRATVQDQNDASDGGRTFRRLRRNGRRRTNLGDRYVEESVVSLLLRGLKDTTTEHTSEDCDENQSQVIAKGSANEATESRKSKEDKTERQKEMSSQENDRPVSEATRLSADDTVATVEIDGNKPDRSEKKCQRPKRIPKTEEDFAKRWFLPPLSTPSSAVRSEDEGTFYK